jgi:hypothetical protein
MAFTLSQINTDIVFHFNCQEIWKNLEKFEGAEDLKERLDKRQFFLDLPA